ncbi:hypothetical protein GGR50DRAFT_338851 [Xylaria sp. CBS 124048]|nr:hypothetical protein GGR50DRAFT_338851 [Xylaria sp. CBS 124048]
MARKHWVLQLLTWTASIPIASSQAVGLGSDIASLVPTCAQSCLRSFISSNYPTAECGTGSTLPCLCPAQSTSGFTLGEAALQCLYGYIQLGRCDKQDADGSTLARVYNICSGQRSALPNTHPILTATLVIPPSGEPSLLPPSSPQTTFRMSSTSSQTTLSASSTTTSSHISSTTTSSQASSSVTSVRTMSMASTITSSATLSSNSSKATTTVVATSEPTSAPTSAASSTKRLAPAQVAGISVGIAGAVGLALGAIFLARYMRRRKYPNSDSEKGLYQNDNSTASFDPLASTTSRIFHISPPVLPTPRYRPDFGPRPAPPTLRGVPPEVPTQPMNTDRNTIGLAISRPRSLALAKSSPQLRSSTMSSPRIVEEPTERRNSKLLPPRPNLTLDIPPKAAATVAPSAQDPPTADRGSTFTNMTAFADLDSAAAEGAQVWRPPTSDPLSASTLYFADKHGNWVLSNNHRRSQIARVLEAAKPRTHMSLPKPPMGKQGEAANTAGGSSTSAALPQASRPAFLSQSPTSWENSQFSSIYSQPSAAQQGEQKFTSSSKRASRSQRGNRPVTGRSDSKTSATTIQSASSGWNDNWFTHDDEEVYRPSQLLVKESSDSETRARVNYPKIPGRLDGATIRFVPPPKRPNFEDMASGQRNSSLGAVYPVRESSFAYYPPPLNPRRNERRLTPVQRNGSGFSPELPNVEVFPLRDRYGAGGMLTSESDPYLDSQHHDIYEPPPRQFIPTSVPPPFSFADKKRSLTSRQPGDKGHNLPHIASQHARSGTNPGAGSAGASSLLEKRVGSNKAAALALGSNRPKARHWRRQDDDPGLIVTPGATTLESPTRGTLPRTPGWQPRLTPTRRGDDLFLNVQ